MAKAEVRLAAENIGHELGAEVDNKFWLESEQIGDTCIQHQNQIIVYLNGNGDIVIRQEDQMNDEDDMVCVNRQNVKALIIALKDILKGL